MVSAAHAPHHTDRSRRFLTSQTTPLLSPSLPVDRRNAGLLRGRRVRRRRLCGRVGQAGRRHRRHPHRRRRRRHRPALHGRPLQRLLPGPGGGRPGGGRPDRPGALGPGDHPGRRPAHAHQAVRGRPEGLAGGGGRAGPGPRDGGGGGERPEGPARPADFGGTRAAYLTLRFFFTSSATPPRALCGGHGSPTRTPTRTNAPPSLPRHPG